MAVKGLQKLWKMESNGKFILVQMNFEIHAQYFPNIHFS